MNPLSTRVGAYEDILKAVPALGLGSPHEAIGKTVTFEVCQRARDGAGADAHGGVAIAFGQMPQDDRHVAFLIAPRIEIVHHPDDRRHLDVGERVERDGHHRGDDQQADVVA